MAPHRRTTKNSTKSEILDFTAEEDAKARRREFQQQHENKQKAHELPKYRQVNTGPSFVRENDITADCTIIPTTRDDQSHAIATTTNPTAEAGGLQRYPGIPTVRHARDSLTPLAMNDSNLEELVEPSSTLRTSAESAERTHQQATPAKHNTAFYTPIFRAIQLIYRGFRVTATWIKTLAALINQIALWLAIFAGVIITVTVILYVLRLGSTAVWAMGKSFNIVDQLTKAGCHWSKVNLGCVWACANAPFLVLYTFPKTCASLDPQNNLDILSYWDPDGGLMAGISNIPMFLFEQQSSCMEHSARFHGMQNDLAMTENDGKELVAAYDRFCSYLVDMSSDLPDYYRHVNIFS
ncbi:MAG: hypothetical protein Q9170_002529 [Blastenia crenularia]